MIPRQRMTDRECMLMGEGTKVKGESDNFDFRGICEAA